MGARILIVDDDEPLRDILVIVLEDRGYEILQASGGHEAASFLKRESVDLVISDVRMPDGDGIELLKSIRERNSKVPLVIVMTGYTDVSVDEIKRLGAQAVFYKPFNSKKLLSSVEQVLAQGGA